MKRPGHLLVLMTAVLLIAVAGVALRPRHSAGQQPLVKERLLGTWTLVSIEAVRQDGSRSASCGTNPKGVAMFDARGHYIISVMRSDRPAFAINDRMQGTAEENKATSHGTITYFGTYSVSETDPSMLIHIDASSFPNWNEADQKRLVILGEDQLTLTVPPAPTGGTAIEVVWKRPK
jgi:hypothetical protein